MASKFCTRLIVVIAIFSVVSACSSVKVSSMEGKVSGPVGYDFSSLYVVQSWGCSNERVVDWGARPGSCAFMPEGSRRIPVKADGSFRLPELEKSGIKLGYVNIYALLEIWHEGNDRPLRTFVIGRDSQEDLAETFKNLRLYVLLPTNVNVAVTVNNQGDSLPFARIVDVWDVNKHWMTMKCYLKAQVSAMQFNRWSRQTARSDVASYEYECEPQDDGVWQLPQREWIVVGDLEEPKISYSLYLYAAAVFPVADDRKYYRYGVTKLSKAESVLVDENVLPASITDGGGYTIEVPVELRKKEQKGPDGQIDK